MANRQENRTELACNAISEILDSYIDAGVYPYKKDVATDMRDRGIYVTTTHLSNGVIWAEPLSELTSYAQALAVSKGITPQETRGRSITRAA